MKLAFQYFRSYKTIKNKLAWKSAANKPVCLLKRLDPTLKIKPVVMMPIKETKKAMNKGFPWDRKNGTDISQTKSGPE